MDQRISPFPLWLQLFSQFSLQKEGMLPAPSEKVTTSLSGMCRYYKTVHAQQWGLPGQNCMLMAQTQHTLMTILQRRSSLPYLTYYPELNRGQGPAENWKCTLPSFLTFRRVGILVSPIRVYWHVDQHSMGHNIYFFFLWFQQGGETEHISWGCKQHIWGV